MNKKNTKIVSVNKRGWDVPGTVLNKETYIISIRNTSLTCEDKI